MLQVRNLNSLQMTDNLAEVGNFSAIVNTAAINNDFEDQFIDDYQTFSLKHKAQCIIYLSEYLIDTHKREIREWTFFALHVFSLIVNFAFG